MTQSAYRFVPYKFHTHFAVFSKQEEALFSLVTVWSNWNNCEIPTQLMGKAKKVKRESGWKKSERTDIRLTERASGVMW